MTQPSDLAADAPTHVIVGDGITAFAFLETGRFAPGERVVVVGRQATQLGRGAAYATGEAGTPWRYAYLLNSPADDIDPAFARWLSQNWDRIVDRMQGRSPDWLSMAAPLVAAGDTYGVNAPREFYGDFMAERLEEIVHRLQKTGVSVSFLTDEAVSLKQSQDGLLIGLASGGTLRARSVDVAPGGPSTMRIDGDDGPFAAPSVFGHEHRIARHIEAGEEIFCIGGNAAMLDVLRLCQSLLADDDIRFVACAPDGEVPPPLVPRLPRRMTQPRLTTGHATADSFLAEVGAEIDRARADGDEMREIRAGFRAHFLDTPLSVYVPDLNEARRVPGTLRLWLRGGTRDTIQDMHRLIGAGRARVMQGLVAGVEHGPDGAVVRLVDATGTETLYQTGFVVNCAGAGPNSRFDPLTADLLRQGLIDLCPVTRGLRVGEACRTGLAAVRYLSPSVTQIGDDVMAMPLYDAHMLRAYVDRSGGRALTTPDD
ncbi:FAD/NAD(P)-binding protein [Pseudooctadecabacter sp.]|uniref:FAD/NAD(P)-binding protein n=1 Tax=Pseudooctadecabacter sp. TaxID=1966338 RepID=UPI0025E71645|nr:FAD/NAD(P)-binding protein [Pseudooctadecabacter sp.]